MIARILPASAAAAALALALAGCSGSAPDTATSADGKVSIVASTDVWGDIAETIGGDAVTVTSVISDPNKDPHEYEADARTQLAISKARLLIENGGGYDDFMDTMRKAANATAPVIDAVEVSGKDADAEGFNEHVWYDYPTVQKVADAIEKAIVKADPSAAKGVEKRADAFEEQLSDLASKVTADRTKADGAGVAITEPVPLYLLEALGAVDKTPEKFSESVEDGTDAPASVLQETLDLFSKKQVAALVYNAQTSGPQTDAVVDAAKKADIPVVGVTETLPDGTHYIAWQTRLLGEITAALTTS